MSIKPCHMRSHLHLAGMRGAGLSGVVGAQGLTNEELLRGVKTAWDKGWRQVKLYFM